MKLDQIDLLQAKARENHYQRLYEITDEHCGVRPLWVKDSKDVTINWITNI